MNAYQIRVIMALNVSILLMHINVNVKLAFLVIHAKVNLFLKFIYYYFLTRWLIERAACFNNPCKSGGTCNIDSDGAEVCLCKDGFTGTFCEIDINECSSSPCQNGGTCIDLENSYACYCPDGYFRPTYCPPQETFTQPAIMIPSTSNISFLFI